MVIAWICSAFIKHKTVFNVNWSASAASRPAWKSGPGSRVIAQELECKAECFFFQVSIIFSNKKL